MGVMDVVQRKDIVNNKQEIIVMVGLPLSGKSTVVDNMVKTPFSDHFTIVCPDDVRMALYGQEYVKTGEKFVWATVDVMIRSLLLRGQSVIVDATNKSKWERQQWYKLAQEFGIPLRIIHVSTSAKECVRRAEESGRTEMIEVIERMADGFEDLEEDERFLCITI